MNTPKINPVYNLLALFGDGLTAYQLAYKGDHPTHDDTRFSAAARIASNSFGVIPYDAPGYFSVMSDDPKQPERRYDVCALPGELSCTCSDGTNSKHNKTGICKHTAAALMRYVLEEV
jgi:hypothetical protein